MTIKECIDIVESLKPNQYTIREKVMWLSFIEGIIINEVLKTHEGYDGKYDLFEGYSEDKLTLPLIVQSPYDRLYTEFLKMKIDEANGETARYNNSMVLFNSYMDEFRKYYNKTHMPLDPTSRRTSMPPQKAQSVGLTDAEYENIKKDLTYIMTEYFGKKFSEDKISDIVNTFIKNNIAMLKGKDGRDGINGKDGKNGTDGINGRDGINGKDGKQGEKGDKGDKGERGEKGEQGLPGADGKDGTFQDIPDYALATKKLSASKLHEFDGTTLASNKIYHYTVVEDCTFTLPTVTDTNTINQILVYADVYDTFAISWVDESGNKIAFVGDEIASIDAGYYRIIFEYNPLLGKWVAGVIKDGA